MRRLRVEVQPLSVAHPRPQKLVALHPLPAWLHDARTLQFLDVNTAMVALCGYTREELLAMKVTDLRADARTRRSAAPGASLAGSPPTRWRLRPKRGKTIDVHTTSRRVRVHRRAAVLVLAHQVTWAGRGAQDSAATLPIGIFRSTANGTIIDANPMFVRMLAYRDRETLLARRAVDLYVDPKARARWLAKLERSGVVTGLESELRRFDGSTIWVRASARVVRRPEGGTAYLEGAIIDITERRRAEAMQAQRTAELQAFYDLSRQLRTASGVEEMYPLIVERARSVLGAYHGCLGLLNPERQVFTRVYTVGIVTEKIGSTFPCAGTRSGRVVGDGTPFVSADMSRERLPEWMESSPFRNLGALAIVPVRSEEGIIGTLCAARTKGPGRPAFTEPELRLLGGIAEVAGIAIQRARLDERLQDAYVQLILALAHALAARDAGTARHCERVVTLAERIARGLGCSEQEVQDIRWGAQLHDIGKIGLPDVVLQKPTALTEEEWTAIRQHPILGEEILGSVQRMRGAAKLVRHHQERWDGAGYPDGLKGEAIPLGARILAAADAYVAITETRPYMPARSHAEAVAVIRRCAGSQFDPRVVEVFSRVVEELHDAVPYDLQAKADPPGQEGPGQAAP